MRGNKWQVAAWSLAFVAGGVQSALAQTFDHQGIELLSHIDLAQFGVPTGNGNSCWGWVSPAGREYAIMGLNNQVAFVDITDPRNPVVRATVPHTNSLWCDVKSYGNYCYTGNEAGGGIQVINIANLDAGVATLVRNVTTNGLSNSHTLAVDADSGFLYSCGSTSVTNSRGGPVAWSLADPSNPTFAGQWGVRYSHEAQIVTYTSGPYAGRQICFAFNESSGMGVIDVTDKANMITLSTTPYPGVTYCHQGWLSPDRRYVYIDDEIDGPAQGVTPTLTRIMNVENLSAPFLAGTFTSATPGSTDHNLYLRDNLLYEANYHSDLRVYDMGYDGLWNNYPFLPSRNSVLSDIDRGMFVVRVLDNSVVFFPVTTPVQVPVATPTAVVVDVRSHGSPLNASNVVLHTRVGSGPFTTHAMTEVSAGRFQANLPGAGCFGTISYYFSATNQAGTSFVFPTDAPAGVLQASAIPPVANQLVFDMETDAGWVGGQPGDTATLGQWERGDPEATTAQPGDDHSATGVNCWITGRLAGSGAGSFDVDNGLTTLLSPAMNLAGSDPNVRIGYWRWYSNSAGGAPNTDTFRVDISTNNGASWVNAETVGPAGAETSGTWFYHDFRVADFVAPSSTVRVRFVAEDIGTGSLVEAAVDDFAVFGYQCPVPTCDPDVNQDGNVDQDDVAYLINVVGGGPNPSATDPDFNHDGNVDQDDIAALINVVAGAACP